MKITKFGHCCLLIEDAGTMVLTDPGVFTPMDDVLAIADLYAVVITHEHADHLHIESLKKILEKNPQAKIITNTEVKDLLSQESIACEVVENGASTTIGTMLIEAYGTQHAFMHEKIPQSTNTGYFFAGKLFYPGDALTDPKRPVEILALPIAAPWVKISEVIDYALLIKPRHAFPVHDAILATPEMFARIFNTGIKTFDTTIQLEILELAKPKEF